MKVTASLDNDPHIDQADTSTIEHASLMAAMHNIYFGPRSEEDKNLDRLTLMARRLRSSPAFVALVMGEADGSPTIANVANDFNLQHLCSYMFLAGQMSYSIDGEREKQRALLAAYESGDGRFYFGRPAKPAPKPRGRKKAS